MQSIIHRPRSTRMVREWSCWQEINDPSFYETLSFERLGNSRERSNSREQKEKEITKFYAIPDFYKAILEKMLWSKQKMVNF